MSNAPVPSLPAELGRYHVAGLLATGGMAEVFLGRESGPHGFERPVVIKRILPHLARDSKFVSMFLDEARIVATIRHSNVVQVYELLQQDDELALVMEFLEGESADVLLRRLSSRSRRLPFALAAHIVIAACAGLHAAHELTDDSGAKRELVHRDVSPHNLLVTYDGQVKVIDFGIAQARGRASKTETGHIKGKFAYMSPEQCSGETLDRRSDVFSLGVVLYELATCHRAFKRATDLMTMRAICDDPIVKPSEVVDDFPPALEAVIVRALSRKRGDRYASAADMRRDLLKVMRELPLDDAPDAALGKLMVDLFEEQIEQKRLMLQKVARGEKLDLSETASDDDGLVPTAASGEPTRTRSAVWATRTQSGPRKKRTLLVLAAAVAAATLWIGLRQRGDALQAMSFAPPLPDVPATSASVLLTVNSTPAGASVALDGSALGVTPLKVELPAAASLLELRVTRAGHEPFVERLKLSADQHVQLQLKPLPQEDDPPVVKPRPAPSGRRTVDGATVVPTNKVTPKPAPKKERDFHGFD